VEDVARAFDVILHKGVTGEIYNIGSEEEFENIDILQRLIKLFRAKYPQCLNPALPDSHYVTFVRDRAFNDFRYHIDSSSLYALGWQRKETDLDAGIEKTVAWYMANPKHWPNVESALAAHPYLLPDLKNNYATPTLAAQSAGMLPAPPALTLQSSAPALEMPAGNASTKAALKWLIYGHKGWCVQHNRRAVRTRDIQGDEQKK